MQLKRPQQHNQAPQEFSSRMPASSYGQDTFKRKVILFGIGAGVMGALGVGAWIMVENPRLVTKIERLASNPQSKMPAEQIQPAHAPMPEPIAVIPAPPPPPVTIPVMPVVPEVRKPEIVAEPPIFDDLMPIENKVRKKKSVVNTKKKSSKSRAVAFNFKKSTPEVFYYSALNSGPVVFAPQGTRIEVSRDPNFNQLYIKGVTDKSGEFRITNPPPGDIYWRIPKDKSEIKKGQKNKKQAAVKVNKIKIYPPAGTDLELKIAGNLKMEDSFSWNGNENVGFYKIEVSKSSNFNDIVKTFSTKETTMKASLIGAGSWFVRVAALNLQKGTFDYSYASALTISGPLGNSGLEMPTDELLPVDGALLMQDDLSELGLGQAMPFSQQTPLLEGVSKSAPISSPVMEQPEAALDSLSPKADAGGEGVQAGTKSGTNSGMSSISAEDMNAATEKAKSINANVNALQSVFGGGGAPAATADGGGGGEAAPAADGEAPAAGGGLNPTSLIPSFMQ